MDGLIGMAIVSHPMFGNATLIPRDPAFTMGRRGTSVVAFACAPLAHAELHIGVPTPRVDRSCTIVACHKPLVESRLAYAARQLLPDGCRLQR